jgi:hypothetical protein
MRSRVVVALAGVWAAVASLGCGGAAGLDGTVPIRGRVSYQGKPLTDAEVQYLPKDVQRGRLARGKVQADGSFVMTTLRPGDGVLPGEYRVVVYAFEPHPGEPGRGENGGESLVNYDPKSRIPAEYADAEKTPLKDVVDGGHSGVFNIEIPGS